MGLKSATSFLLIGHPYSCRHWKYSSFSSADEVTTAVVERECHSFPRLRSWFGERTYPLWSSNGMFFWLLWVNFKHSKIEHSWRNHAAGSAPVFLSKSSFLNLLSSQRLFLYSRGSSLSLFLNDAGTELSDWSSDLGLQLPQEVKDEKGKYPPGIPKSRKFQSAYLTVVISIRDSRDSQKADEGEERRIDEKKRCKDGRISGKEWNWEIFTRITFFRRNWKEGDDDATEIFGGLEGCDHHRVSDSSCCTLRSWRSREKLVKRISISFPSRSCFPPDSLL